ncbi:XPG domain containing-domain-containing protein [Microdochium bolleyi]|uniref:XPG domain containing-domain-containing protein n=1 Tax=Microdochium bolleyi TaxID=196109 RepID=A0A136JDP9_9PEZI|nr:XPG domain containing-domain-containing protein [Microdochium bolleyi]
MGIRGLTDAVRPFGTPAALDHNDVVIDGPALVHKILSGCLLLGPRGKTYFCQPSYAELGEITIAWLDKLKTHDITVRKIYFDGFLPSSKWDVRIQRLNSQTEKLRRLASQEVQGMLVPPSDVFKSIVPDISITRVTGHNPNELLPHPAFLVPAVIDALRRHDCWGSLIQLVPGEADDFCIADIKENGGTVITSDSDLLVQDLGVNGFVCFFSDLAESRRDGESSLQALKFNYQMVNQKLGIEDHGGLLRVAFEMDQRKAPLSTAIKFAKKAAVCVFDSPKYTAFTEEHSPRTHISPDHPVLEAILTIDPRVSELVVQSQLLRNSSITPTSGMVRGHHRLSMFLPILTEDTCRKSSWTMSTKIRALAYSHLQTVSPCESQPVVEYRLLSSGRSQGGREVEILDATQFAGGRAEIFSTLAALGQDPELKQDLWFSFAIWLEMQWAAGEYDSPASVSLLERAKRSKGLLQRYPWSLVHFTAQINATLYSLRMLQQVLRAVKVLSPDMHDKDNDDLCEVLARLPGIDQWPTVDMVQPLLVKLGSTGLSSIARSLGIPDRAATKPATVATKKRKKSSSNTASSRNTAPRTGLNNPFALLGQEDG